MQAIAPQGSPAEHRRTSAPHRSPRKRRVIRGLHRWAKPCSTGDFDGAEQAWAVEPPARRRGFGSYPSRDDATARIRADVVDLPLASRARRKESLPPTGRPFDAQAPCGQPGAILLARCGNAFVSPVASCASTSRAISRDSMRGSDRTPGPRRRGLALPQRCSRRPRPRVYVSEPSPCGSTFVVAVLSPAPPLFQSALKPLSPCRLAQAEAEPRGGRRSAPA